jgi:hypothetical protein
MLPPPFSDQRKFGGGGIPRLVSAKRVLGRRGYTQTSIGYVLTVCDNYMTLSDLRLH